MGGLKFSGSYSFILPSKLKALKADLKVWHHEVFDNISFKKEAALIKVGFWNAKQREEMLNMEEVEASRVAREEISGPYWAEAS